MPAASLPALEQHLKARLLELDRLYQARPGLPTAVARALTLADAAVKLRRLGAYI